MALYLAARERSKRCSYACDSGCRTTRRITGIDGHPPPLCDALTTQCRAFLAPLSLLCCSHLWETLMLISLSPSLPPLLSSALSLSLCLWRSNGADHHVDSSRREAGRMGNHVWSAAGLQPWWAQTSSGPQPGSHGWLSRPSSRNAEETLFNSRQRTGSVFFFILLSYLLFSSPALLSFFF